MASRGQKKYLPESSDEEQRTAWERSGDRREKERKESKGRVWLSGATGRAASKQPLRSVPQEISDDDHAAEGASSSKDHGTSSKAPPPPPPGAVPGAVPAPGVRGRDRSVSVKYRRVSGLISRTRRSSTRRVRDSGNHQR